MRRPEWLPIHFHRNGTGFRENRAVRGTIVANRVRVDKQLGGEAFQILTLIGAEDNGTASGGVAPEQNREIEAVITITLNKRWHQALDSLLIVRTIFHVLRS